MKTNRNTDGMGDFPSHKERTKKNRYVLYILSSFNNLINILLVVVNTR